MRAGKLDLLRRCNPGCRWISNSSQIASSSSLLAPRPKSVLDWQRELLSPSPSSQVLLGSLYQAIQSPFPPIQQDRVWIEAEDVEATLKLVLSESIITDRSERKDMLDIINLCIKRCLNDAKKRVSVKVQMDHERQGVSLTDVQKQDLVNQHSAVKAWQHLISSRRLAQHRLQNAMTIRRRPLLDDLQEALTTVQQSSSFGCHELNQLLSFITRFMPTPREEEKKERFLEMGTVPSDLRLDLMDRAVEISTTSTLPSLETLLDDHDGTDLLPQDVVRLFKRVWIQLCQLAKPDAISFGIALLLESKLAPWRGMLSGSDDLFEPLRQVVHRLLKKKMLDTSHINQLMWATLRYDPAVHQPFDLPGDVKWPNIDDCVEMYQEMRGNAVRVEMEWERRQSGEPERTMGSASTPNTLLQRLKGLPIPVLPDQITYELLIRGFAWHGDLQRAASTLNEMTQSCVDTQDRLDKLRRDKVDNKEEEPPSLLYTATSATYDSFFRGFARHATPYTLVHFDPSEPRASEWKAIEGEKEHNDWSIEALKGIFEEYLNIDPEKCRMALKGYRRSAPVRKKTWQFEDEVDQDDWYMVLDDSMMQLWDSIISLEYPEAGYLKTSPAPTPRQLFFVLTALRRASNDNAMWVLSQWQRVVDKFGHSMQLRHGQKHGSDNVNAEGWTGWKVDDRLVRILEHLRSKL
jgi:hypothetical protein